MCRWRLAWLALGVGLFGCSEGEVSDEPLGGGGLGRGTAGNAGTSGITAGNGAGATAGLGAGASAGSAGSSGMAPLPMGIDPAALIPARIRRLTNAEYDATVRVLTKTNQAHAAEFAPDARQNGYTLNDAQRVDSVIVRQMFTAAAALATEAKGQLAELAPCEDSRSEAEACATRFIQSFGERAYRRPLSAEEASGLLEVYREGALDAAYADGIELVMRAVLQSAGFLYLTELGDRAAAADGSISLTPHELASSLSYLVTGGPPDAALLESALSGNLFTPAGRDEQIWRLIEATDNGRPVARDRLVRVVQEWFGVDRIEHTDKDANVYGQYRDLKASITTESREFITNVLMGAGTVGEMLSADWSVVDADLARFYGVSGSGRVSLPGRRGILNQAAFLAAYSHATESGPVLRGVAVARRVACMLVPSPTQFTDVVVTVPAPDPSLTTRERFSQHSSDERCASCHNLIDPIGFTFEQFDGAGELRTMDNGHPVNSATTLQVGADFDGSYPDSNALALALAESVQVRECMARQLFRASAARSDTSVAASEAAFVALWKQMPENEQASILSTLVSFVTSPLFTHRRAL